MTRDRHHLGSRKFNQLQTLTKTTSTINNFTVASLYMKILLCIDTENKLDISICDHVRAHNIKAKRIIDVCHLVQGLVAKKYESLMVKLYL